LEAGRVNGTAAYRLDGRRVARDAFYAAACDPRRHVCVEACAGAGKTWMLVARIVRALLDGAAPQEVLAITFTRRAAGEMRTRLAQWLQAASQMSPDEAAAQLREYGLPAADAAQRAGELIGLYERVLDSNQHVDVRTMHAWFAQLLAAAPMELLASLGLGPDLALLEDPRELMPALLPRFHARVRADAALREAHRDLLLRHGRAAVSRWFDAALARRSEIELAAQAGTIDGAVPPADDPHAASHVRKLHVRADVQALALALEQRKTYAADARKAADKLRAALRRDDDRRGLADLYAALFNDEGVPRKRLADTPGYAALCDAVDAWREQVALRDAHHDHAHMARLVPVLFDSYAQLKRERGLVDMNDLERVALVLLSEHELSGWVQQRLDARVRHVLIDEFQDTSPLQWHALQSWLAAYAGAGGGGDAPRVFIVGDPKQSIYRFRGADPRVFQAAQGFVVEALQGSIAACDHTRRCAPGVVDVVNRVFGAWGDGPGLVHWREHTTEIARMDTAPALLALPSTERAASERGDGADSALVWRPSLTVPRHAVKTLPREAEAAAVARAIAGLVNERGVPPERVLVLARKRAALTPVADALAALQVPQVEPEELRLSQLPEAQDLLAMLDVLASPTQSLSLARALKSPLFGADDDDLRHLARRVREQRIGWWTALAQCADDMSASPALQRAARLCAAWAKVAPVLPPHDLLDRIVHEGELLPRLAAAVPAARRARALDAVRALLAAALDLDGGRYATPYGFVRALRAQRIDAPASVQAGALRLLTIHGAKGLEADVVFLVDAQPERTPDERMSVLIDWPVHSPRPTCAAFIASSARCPPALQALGDEEAFERAREEANALYVALTRAKHQLVVSRTPPHRANESPPSWWTRVAPLAAPWADAVAPCEAAPPAPAEVACLPAPRVADALGEAATAPSAAREAAAALGQAVHRVLEWAGRGSSGTTPPFDALARAAARAFGVADEQAVRDVAERIWSSPACRRFFDAAAIEWAGNEVAIAGNDGRPQRIDRLVLLRAPESTWWVLDYKLAADPARDAALQAQLADYRRAVAALVPGQLVRAAFITGQGQLVPAAD
jgi:ATP-dependent helicase/nuclease subunit A